jgi:hypothetical protein
MWRSPYLLTYRTAIGRTYEGEPCFDGVLSGESCGREAVTMDEIRREFWTIRETVRGQR